MNARPFAFVLWMVVAVAPTAPLVAATVSKADFVSLIKQIPPPAASIEQQLARTNDAQVAARFESLDREMSGIQRGLSGPTQREARGAGALSQATANVVGMPQNQQQAQALQKKLAGMTMQEKMAFAMRLRQQQVNAAMHSGAAHAVEPLSPDMQAAYDELMDMSRQFNPANSTAADSLRAEPFSIADSKLETRLQTLADKYPYTQIPGFHGSDELGYEHDNHLCHADYDNRIKRSQASAQVYDAWLQARHDAWAGKAEKMVSMVGREQQLLQKLRYGDALRDRGHDIGYRNMIDLRVHTLEAIHELADEAKKTSDRFPGNIAHQTALMKQTLATCLTAD